MIFLSLVSSFALVGCGNSDDPTAAEHGFSSDTAGWTESIVTTSPWPSFGGGTSGVVTAPRWQEPKRFGCAVRLYAREEPDRDFQPGDGPKTVYGDELDSTCRAPGVVIDIIDAPTDDEASLIDGTCAAGFQLKTETTVLATLQFGAELSCEAFAASRAAIVAANSGHQQITLRLVTVSPPVMEITAAADATDHQAYGVTEH